MSVSFKEYTIREYTNGTKEWRVNGEFHREDGPAYEQNGHKEWYLNGKLHREDGPAIEQVDGHKYWYLNGKLHREDGPAIEYADGTKEWWLNDKEVDSEQHLQQTQSCTGKVVEIDGKKYVLTEVEDD